MILLAIKKFYVYKLLRTRTTATEQNSWFFKELCAINISFNEVMMTIIFVFIFLVFLF